jgi:nucleoside-diphosphate-sugar epimerase
MNRTICVTGATGLIGHHLVPALLDSGHHVVTVSRTRQVPRPGVTGVVADLTAADFCERLPARVDAVVHLAQSEHFRDFPGRADDIFAVNVASTARLLDWARRAGARQFIHASSGGIYGHGGNGFTEDDAGTSTGPLGYYLSSKRAAELLCQAYEECLAVSILRFFFVYGPGQRADMLIPRLARSVLEGRPIVLQGENGLRCNPIHVSDAVRAIAGALSLTSGARVNVAGIDILSLREIGLILGGCLQRDPVFQVEREAQPRDLVGRIDRLVQLFGPPQVHFADGVAVLCEEAAAERRR